MAKAPVLLFKRIDLITIVAGILLSPGVYIYGEYQFYVVHSGYQMHEFVAAYFSIAFVVCFAVIYGADKVPFLRTLSVLLVSTTTAFLTFVLYANFFDLRPLY